MEMINAILFFVAMAAIALACIVMVSSKKISERVPHWWALVVCFFAILCFDTYWRQEADRITHALRKAKEETAVAVQYCSDRSQIKHSHDDLEARITGLETYKYRRHLRKKSKRNHKEDKQ